MCDAVRYVDDNGFLQLVYYANPNATLPVRLKGGGHLLLPWGRRESQSPHLPLGGSIRLDDLHAGKCQRFAPRPVKLSLTGYLTRDCAQTSQWVNLLPLQWVQGVLLQTGKKLYCYIVTIDVADIGDKPRVLS